MDMANHGKHSNGPPIPKIQWGECDPTLTIDRSGSGMESCHRMDAGERDGIPVMRSMEYSASDRGSNTTQERNRQDRVGAADGSGEGEAAGAGVTEDTQWCSLKGPPVGEPSLEKWGATGRTICIQGFKCKEGHGLERFETLNSVIVENNYFLCGV